MSSTVSADSPVPGGHAPARSGSRARGCWLLAGVLLWVGLNAATWSHALQPLPELNGLWGILWAVGAVGAGLVARSRIVLVAALTAPLAAHVFGYYEGLREPLPIAEASVPVAAGLLWLGVVIGRRFRRGRTVGLAIMSPAVALAAWAGFLWTWPHDHAPAHPRLVDTRRWDFDGVRLGDTASAVRTNLGTPSARDTSGIDWNPIGASPVDGVNYLPQYQAALRYAGVSVVMIGGTATVIFATGGDAQTGKGVGVGDTLALVSRRYPDARCGLSGAGDPACAVVGDGHQLVFGGDPIQSVAIASIDIGWCWVNPGDCERAPSR